MNVKGIFRKGMRYLLDSDYRFVINANRGFHNGMTDEAFIKRKYKAIIGKELNLENPQTFNEKLQWLKLYNRKPEFTTMVDKCDAKKYVANIIGEEYIIPTLGVWKSFDDINFDNLPQQFVLKCTHDCGGIVICKDKNKLDKAPAKKKLEKSLKNNFFWYGREWPYKNVEPRIIAEVYMEEAESSGLTDYKVMCFGGEPKVIQVHQGRFDGNHHQAFYDLDWNHLDITQGFPKATETIPRPAALEKMLELSRVLSKGLPHLRVDWYFVKGQLYLGELTFFDGSGFVGFDQEEWDRKLGSYITLPPKTNLQ